MTEVRQFSDKYLIILPMIQ